MAWWPTKKLMICTNTYIHTHTQASKRESKTLTHQILVTTLSDKYADRDTYKQTRDLEETSEWGRVTVPAQAAPTKKEGA